MEVKDLSQFDVTIPGRLCILGEHSDWAASYKVENESIPHGYAIVCATNEALHCYCKKLSEVFLSFKSMDDKKNTRDTIIPLDHDYLSAIANDGSFFSYVAGTAAAVLSKYLPDPKYGIEIDNYQSSLPFKKGLSSSAAVCVLVAECFNKIYDLQLSRKDIMELAFVGESVYTPSECGRMDQCVAMGKESIALMKFQHDGCHLETLSCPKPLFFVVGDLNAGKDTVVILRDLNKCFPFPTHEHHSLMHSYVRDNEQLALIAATAIENGDIDQLAQCMKQSQANFDLAGTANCPEQLASPRLHSLFEDPILMQNALAMKGVGSQGDGSIQILCRDESKQQLVYQRLCELGCEAFLLTIPSTLSPASMDI